MSSDLLPTDLLPTRDAAKYLGVSIRSLWLYRARGFISGQRVGPHRMFLRDELDTVKLMREHGLMKPGWRRGRKRK